MSVQAWKRRLACQWSVERMFPAIDEALLFRTDAERVQPAWAYQSFGYLWTFTFADKECREDGRLAMARWAPFQEWLKRSGHRGVRAIERGYRSGHFHFHVVTDQWWSATEIHAKCKEYRIGRPDVKEVPVERISYIAKYVGKLKPRWKMPKGMRLWAAFGFQGCRTNAIRFSEKTLTVVPDTVTYPYRGDVIWALDGETIFARRNGPSRIPGADYCDITMNITKENAAHLVSLLAAGNMLVVGEYRTMSAREMRFTDEDSGKEKVRKLVEHGIEIGDEKKTEQITVTEWLPDTADIANVKASVAKGEPVVIEIDAFSRKYGVTARSIRSLASFGGKL